MNSNFFIAIYKKIVSFCWIISRANYLALCFHGPWSDWLDGMMGCFKVILITFFSWYSTIYCTCGYVKRKMIWFSRVVWELIRQTWTFLVLWSRTRNEHSSEFEMLISWLEVEISFRNFVQRNFHNSHVSIKIL